MYTQPKQESDMKVPIRLVLSCIRLEYNIQGARDKK